MKFRPAISIFLGIVVTILIFGIAVLFFGEASGVLWFTGFFAVTTGGFIATYFTKNKKIRYGLYVGIILTILMLILDLEDYNGDIGDSILFFVLFSVITCIGGFFGKITDKNKRQEFKKGLKKEYKRYKTINGGEKGTFKRGYKQEKSSSNTIYCPQCGLKDSSNSRFCADCGEDLETGRNYLKRTRYLQYISAALILMFFISLIIAGSGMSTGDYSLFVIPILFFILTFISILLYKLILPFISGHARRYCPKCEHHDFNGNFCVNCGYNLENVLSCFKCNLGADLYDIELNKRYINLYRHIIEHQVDGSGEYHERLAPKTLYLGSIRNIRLSSCKTLIIFTQTCLKFEYYGSTLKFKVYRENINELNRILSMEVYRDIISQGNLE